MSRIGKKPINLVDGVTATLQNNELLVKGQELSLVVPIHQNVKVEIRDGQILVSRIDDTKLSRSVHGLTRTLISNAIAGVTSGFEKQLEIVGVGYRATVEDGKLNLKLGFSHEIKIEPKESISFEVKKNIITIKGSDKQLVGQTAAEIRNLRKPEPYKGKGIKYVGEHIIRKVGKAVKGAGA